MDIVCVVCGDIGQMEELVICSVCQTIAQHKYCARDPANPPRDWSCESCIKQPDIITEERKLEAGSTGLKVSSLNGQLPYLSTPIAWKGSLEVNQVDGNILVELAAYLPLQVSATLYNVTKALPIKLEMKMVPCSIAWPKHFEMDSPILEDIGVFLLPSDRRSSLKCISLLRKLDSGKHALQMNLSSSLKFVVYSSQQLEEKCQRLGGDLFLWGFFWKRRMRNSLKRGKENKESGDRQFNTSPIMPPNIGGNESSSSTVPEQLDVPPEFGTSDRTVIENEELLVPPVFSRSVEAREENLSSKESRHSPLSMNQALLAKEAITMLAELNEQTEFARVVARVIRLWCAFNPRSRVAWAMKFVLLDSQGTAMEGQMPLAHYQCVSQYFFEGSISEFARFNVEPCPKNYHTVSHKFILKFTGDTTIKVFLNSSHEIPFHYFEFVRFEDIGTSITGDTRVVDIIGRLANIDQVKTINKGGPSVRLQQIHLVNERNFPMEITIWEEFLNVLPQATLVELSKECPVVLACNSLCLTTYRGRTGLKTALKTHSGTRFYSDQNMPFIAEFRASNLQGQFNPIVVNPGQPVSMQNIGSSSTMMNPQQPRVTIGELQGYGGSYSNNNQFWTSPRPVLPISYPIPTRYIAESSSHRPDHGKRKVEENLPENRQEYEPGNSHRHAPPAKRPPFFSRPYQRRL